MKAQIDNFHTWIESADEALLKNAIERLLLESGFTILNFMEHRFQPQGYTALWLLAESHCALHTFPEENRSYLEISSCNTELFINFLSAFTRFDKKFGNQ